MKYGRIWAGVGPTVPLGINFHVGKKFGRDRSHCTTEGGRSHCTTREEVVKLGKSWAEVGPTVTPGMNLHVDKWFGRTGSHCTTREELKRRQVPLYHQGGTREEAGPTVPVGKN